MTRKLSYRLLSLAYVFILIIQSIAAELELQTCNSISITPILSYPILLWIWRHGRQFNEIKDPPESHTNFTVQRSTFNLKAVSFQTPPISKTQKTKQNKIKQKKKRNRI